MRSRCAWAIIVLVLALPVWADESPQRPPAAAEMGPKPKPIVPPKAEDVHRAMDRGIEFLLKHQHRDGSWGSANSSRPNEIYAPVPGSFQGFKAAVTAMCIMALTETGGDRTEVTAAIDRAETWLFEHLPKVRRATPDAFYNVWTHAYSVQTLVRMLGRKTNDADRRQKILALIAQQIDMLGRYEMVDGGWAYYDFNAHTQKPSGSTISFVTAAVLVALHEARDAGIEVPQRLVDRGMASIRRQRNPDFSYLYGSHHTYHPANPIDRPGGSLGRSQACNVAMRLWGDKLVTDDVLRTWLDRLFARNVWLDIGRKRPIPHESWFAVAGYFYYFGHYYASLCIQQLPEADRPRFQDYLAHTLLRVQEKDGSWWDFPLYDYHQAYGTAFALMSLKRTLRDGR
ncbi:MAG: terpene cyclase/mutase family protein [Planctomycetaceae bacterium]|nr:terpene cyclase/mutase family protein [Planctomycetaceae bacterium]